MTGHTIVSKPAVTITLTNAAQTVENADQKVLYVGMQQSTAAATSGALTENILDDSSWDSLFGLKSELAAMLRGARKTNKQTRFDAIGLAENGSAVQATSNISIAGTAVDPDAVGGTVTAVIGSARNHSFTTPIVAGTTAANVSSALAILINADTTVPVSADGTTLPGTLAITATQGGTDGNQIGLSMDTSNGLGITSTVAVMSGGAIDPDTTTLFDIIVNRRYQTIVVAPFVDLTELEDLLDPRFNASNDILDGIGIKWIFDSFANLLTTANTNSQSVVVVGDELISEAEYKGPAILELPWVAAAYVGAVRSLRLTEGASISDIVITTNGPLDAFGGPALASKPYFNTPLAQLPIITGNRGFDEVEQGQLKDANISVVGNNTASNGVILSEMVTNYETDLAGNPDITFFFLNFVDTASNIREYISNNLKSRFAQSRLTGGDTIGGRDVANADTIAAFVEQLYQDLAGVDFVLVEGGADAIAKFKSTLIVTLDLANGQATIQAEVAIVTQLREIIFPLKITFSTSQ